MRAQADGGVERRCAVVKKVERPDIDGSPRQIDARGRRRGNPHAGNYNGVMSPSALRRQVGELLIAGFHGHQVPVELRSLAREFSLGGVILFARNIEEPEQVAELAAEAAGLCGDAPVWVSVDQEGGRVARLKAPFTEWPPMATLGRSGEVALAERFARALACELK